jgi:hypothetical protein
MNSRLLPLLLCLAALPACGLIAPYPTAPLAAEPKAPADVGPRVAICYNPLHSTAEQTRDQAQQECAAGTTAARVYSDWYLQNCPLLLPERATFVCAPHK